MANIIIGFLLFASSIMQGHFYFLVKKL